MSFFNFSRQLVAGTPENVNDVQAMLDELRSLVNANLDSANIAPNSLATGNLEPAVRNSLVPAGVIMQFGGSTVPVGYLLCDGTEIAVQYTALIAALSGNPHGVGGAGRPKLPDLRGRVPVGVGTATGAAGATAKALGGVGGEQKHTLAIAELPSHNHGGATGTGTSADDSPDHDHLYGQRGAISVTAGSYGVLALDFAPYEIDTFGARNRHQHAIPALSIPSQGSGTAANVEQPYVAVNHIIRHGH